MVAKEAVMVEGVNWVTAGWEATLVVAKEVDLLGAMVEVMVVEEMAVGTEEGEGGGGRRGRRRWRWRR